MWGIGVCERTGDDLNLGKLVLEVVWIVSTDEATAYSGPYLSDLYRSLPTSNNKTKCLSINAASANLQSV